LRILVTGGAGYIGSVLVPSLLADGNEVTVIDNFMYGQTPLNALCSNPNFRVINGDVRDSRVMSIIKGYDVFIPLAALVGAPLCDRDPIAARSTNVDAVFNTMKGMSINQAIIVPISNSGYGIGESGKECTEESPLKPISLYGQTKVEAEKILMGRENTISLRLATVFGMAPRMRLDLLVNDFVWRAVHDKAVVLFEADFKRNYIHIRDVVAAFTQAIYRFTKMRGQIYNVGLSEANLSKRELCERIKSHVPGFVFLESPIGEDMDKRDYIVSNAKLEATGWRPRWSLDKGIEELVKGFVMLRNTVHGNV
jgi:nucleoside-diphosphate-sugar epimerase